MLRRIASLFSRSRLRQGVDQEFAAHVDMRPEMYLPASQLSRWCCLHTVMRTGPDPKSFESAVRRQVGAMDKDIPVTKVRTMRQLLSQPRFATWLLGIFAGMAVVLTVVGLYGVMAYSVAVRTRELGIRIALGARRSQVLCKVLLEACTMLAIGVTIGIATSLFSEFILSSLLYRADAHNVYVLLVVSAWH